MHQLEGVQFELDMSFLNEVDLTKLDSKHFLLYKQALSFVRLSSQADQLDEDKISLKFN